MEDLSAVDKHQKIALDFIRGIEADPSPPARPCPEALNLELRLRTLESRIEEVEKAARGCGA